MVHLIKCQKVLKKLQEATEQVNPDTDTDERTGKLGFRFGKFGPLAWSQKLRPGQGQIGKEVVQSEIQGY